jgi:hypothetical protein
MHVRNRQMYFVYLSVCLSVCPALFLHKQCAVEKTERQKYLCLEPLA